MIDGILERMIDELGPETKAVATGGQAHLIVERLALSEDGRRAPHARRPADDLGAEPRVTERWSNYFNYFTEIEEHFQRARGTSLFLLSPLDWALIESWKNAGVPLEAVLRGIDAAFEKWRSRKVKTQMVNSLAFCAQAVLTEAQIMAGAGAPASAKPPRRPFRWKICAPTWKAMPPPCPYPEIADSLAALAAEVEEHYNDLEAWNSASPCSKRR